MQSTVAKTANKVLNFTPVIFEYEQLMNSSLNLTSQIEEAFGTEGYGLCVVKNVPKYLEYRAELLPLAQKVAQLPKEKLDKLVFPETYYQVGWSHGIEKFQGKEDFSKGSYYANPQYDNPKKDPNVDGLSIFPENRWPREELPELEMAFKNLGQLVVSTGVLLAGHIDKYVRTKVPNYEENKIQNLLKESQTCKGRLLHYFPSNSEADLVEDWCGWHNDNGSLTGLCGAMYLDKEGKQVDFVDEESGLFIQNRKGEIKRAQIPKGCLAFQIGEASQIHSGGHLYATPHNVVRGKKLVGTGISRNTFAVFMQPNPSVSMSNPQGIEREYVVKKDLGKVPPLAERWQSSDNFFEFSKKTFESYY